MVTTKNTTKGIGGITAAIPTDLVGITVLLIVFDGLVFGYPAAVPPLRAVVGLVVVLFVPGYLLLAVLFPRRQSTVDGNDPIESATPTVHRLAHGGRPSWSERLVLSFGLSVAIVPILGLLVTPFTGSLSSQSVFLGLNAFVFAGTVAAVTRRGVVPADERLQLPSWAVRDSLGTIFDRDGNRLLSVVLVLAVVVALASIGLAVTFPASGETYTSTTLLTENDEGELVASGYPSTLDAGASEQLTLRVENYEGVETTYTAVVSLQRVDASGDVSETERVLQEQETVLPGQTWTEPHAITPTMTGENLRLQYHVYRGEPPQNVDEDTAYRTLSLWITVDSSE
ncbi:DUF1616 domain-containing protein [Halapricum hydrolyticum]|uniref:DUF1616 domain-containing protein n=1 Tax=Halapricum hydrolyticum TaxID=2979991 RepID=A0AAE3IGT6_9EURY|nr:DUF1616 domain-containing protein [Halapricum hydrolyticum]MCU4719599.1 DUF1616 domain-containing protein [Halapricum hydrolyticum]MCU4728105.1 DUF1616 domain-containing protein [Halapricum hydrolyticum]